MAEAVRNVLFLSMRNSARSIMAECIMNREGGGRFKGFSAGMQPVEELSQQAVELLRKLNHSVNGMGPKSLDAYADGGAPKMDFVFVVDDTAAEMDLPQLPGKPMVARWKFPDPESHEGSGTERKAMFADVYGRIYNRISIFVNLPFESLDRLALQRRIEEDGRDARLKRLRFDCNMRSDPGSDPDEFGRAGHPQPCPVSDRAARDPAIRARRAENRSPRPAREGSVRFLPSARAGFEPATIRVRT